MYYCPETMFSLFCNFWHFFLIYNAQISLNYNRHSVDVKQKSYIVPEKRTRAISAYNLIREMGDTMGFDKTNQHSNFSHQKTNYC